MCRWVTNHPKLSGLEQLIIALVGPWIDWAHLRCPQMKFVMGSHSWDSRHLMALMCWTSKMAHPHGWQVILAVDLGAQQRSTQTNSIWPFHVAWTSFTMVTESWEG